MPARPSEASRSSAARTPLPLHEAVTCPWLALDGPELRNCLACDIDHADSLERVLALPAGCPRPTLVQDPRSGRSHAVLMLAAPVLTRPGARPKPQRLADLAVCLMAAALRATPMPCGSLIKSPWGRRQQHLIGTLLRRTVVPDTLGVWRLIRPRTTACCGTRSRVTSSRSNCARSSPPSTSNTARKRMSCSQKSPGSRFGRSAANRTAAAAIAPSSMWFGGGRTIMQKRTPRPSKPRPRGSTRACRTRSRGRR